MTARKLIESLLTYPNLDAQVVDTYGSPIMYSLYHDPRNSDDIRLEPKSQMDIKEELDGFHAHAVDEGLSDQDAVDELKERGYTLEDLLLYREDTYEWAKEIW